MGAALHLKIEKTQAVSRRPSYFLSNRSKGEDKEMSKKKILLVDDEAGLTRLMKLNLEATEKYEVRAENKGNFAVKAAKEFKPDIVFCDIIMPDLEGSEVARQMRADPELKNIPIVFLTATITAEEIGLGGGSIGGETFLAKPVTIKQMVDCIKRKIGE